jgi:4-alpha-glucanotransferase
LSPVHALFAADLSHFSPYSPSTRIFLNALHASPGDTFDETAITAAIQRAGVAGTMAALEREPLIDWPRAGRIKYALLRELHRSFGATTGGALQADYLQFCEDGGASLENHARFEALHAAMTARDPQLWHWSRWPQGLRDPEAREVQGFAVEHAQEIDFHRFAQWLAARGFSAAQAAARSAGMAIGLIGDLAVGTDSGGSHAWGCQHDLLRSVSVGAPPDLLNAFGQSWGLTTFSPRALALHGFAPFIELLRATMRYAGGVRIDHVLGLARLWLVPDGAQPKAGAYVHFPLDDMLRLIALESWRQRALVIGEDLGTVPPGFRERLSQAGIYGMRVLPFEQEWGLFTDPSRWTPDAVAMTSTHDLAPVAGWWKGHDLDLRAQLGLFADTHPEPQERQERARQREALWAALRHSGAVHGERPGEDQTEPVVNAAMRHVGAAACRLALVPLEDALGLVEQPNLPGTTDQHPNWRRRMPAAVEQLLEPPAVADRLAALSIQRSIQGPS